ncbi:MAG: ATP-binding protein, partial [Bacteroidota bacterium]
MTDFAIIPAHLAVKAMRDNGYKNMAYALAELIDNSIQAGATQVEVLLAERYELVTEREKRRIYQIAVIDNGSGMNAEVLRMALQFGNGTRLDANKRDGMGRFGMGLPSASVSQCRRVEVWSWQGDITKANYTYLDLDDIEHRRTSEVPIPQYRSVPTMWLKRTEQVGNSGTLVVWSNIDRPTWKMSGSIIKNSELLVGRMYRHFIYESKVKIRMANFNVHVDRHGML